MVPHPTLGQSGLRRPPLGVRLGDKNAPRASAVHPRRLSDLGLDPALEGHVEVRCDHDDRNAGQIASVG